MRAKKERNAETLMGLEPRLAQWFQRKFKTPTDVQERAVAQVLAGRSVLISSPTGSGKTLSAFLGVFNELMRQQAAGPLPLGVVAVYVSPLRALAYDLQKNIRQPLADLGLDDIRVGMRTGDTTLKERAAQKRKPPHILVTTPESLALLLEPGSHGCPALGARKFLIVDEIHALAENKRGTHSDAQRGAPAGARAAAALPHRALRDDCPRWMWSGNFLTGMREPVRNRHVAHAEEGGQSRSFRRLRKNPYPPGRLHRDAGAQGNGGAAYFLPHDVDLLRTRAAVQKVSATD